jgi:Tol biopolymer transport system component
MSPDGQHIAYVGGQQDLIYIRDIDRYEVRALPGTEGADMPAFSPEGTWIAFRADNGIKTVALAGGSPITVTEGGAGGLAWESNESLLFTRATGGIWRVPAVGGTPQELTKVQPGENGHKDPEGLPGGQAILYTASVGGGGLQIYAHSLATGDRHLTDRGSNPQYLRSGHIAYVQDGALVVAPFDLSQLEKDRKPDSGADGCQAASGRHRTVCRLARNAGLRAGQWRRATRYAGVGRFD